jgi:hypothetical protein
VDGCILLVEETKDTNENKSPSHHVDEIMFPNMFLIGPSKFFMRSPRRSQV